MDEEALYPSMLAAIFEQRANQKQMGAYYTKEDVAGYIASNTIIPHLFDAARERCPAAFARGAAMWRLLQANPERYIPAAIRQSEYLPTETEREYTARRARHRQLRMLLESGTIDSFQALVTWNLAIQQFARDVLANCTDLDLLLAFYTSMECMTILDPTCGPGAFLFAALNLLVPLYAACLDRMQALVNNHDASITRSPSTRHAHDHSVDEMCRTILKRGERYASRELYILRTIITNNLYGVDVMPEAIEVCRQRLLLALLARVECADDIEPPPALAANIRVGNALVGSLRNTPTAHNHAMNDLDGQDRQLHSKLNHAFVDVIHQDRQPLPCVAARFIAHGSTLQADGGAINRAATHRETSPTSDQYPFHWPAEFPAVMARGGFDVIIGNPPYIEYSKVRQQYRVGGYETGSCGNVYAAVVERSLALCRSRQSYIGLIVPLSLCGSERFATLRRTILDQTAARWLANFEIFPGRLFEGAFQRLSILIAHRNNITTSIEENIKVGTPHTLAGGLPPFCASRLKQCGSTYVTRIQRWYASERPHLLDLISYTEARHSIKPGVFPKLASPLQETILHKVLERAGGASIATALATERTPHFIYYQEATNYWMKAVCHVPYYKKNGVIMEPPHGRFLFFNDDLTARTIMAVMNSSLFYLWFVTYADGFHLSHALVKEFPTGSDLYSIEKLPLLSRRLEEDIQRHTRLSTRNTRPSAARKKAGQLIELEEYRMGYSRPIIDEIDRALAAYYGFTTDELDFIMNYEIKYRLGQEGR
jgi:hypothetical protein